MPVRVGIIGCGRIARSHAKAFKLHGAEIAALMDLRLEAARELAAEEAPEAACFGNYGEMFDNVELDAVAICATPKAHRELVLASLARGVHVLCEKPLETTIEAGRAIVDAAKASGKLVMTALPHHFRPSTIKMREIIQSGVLGDIVLFECIFSGPFFWVQDAWYTKREIAGEGILLDIGAHSVDIFRTLVGEVVEQHAVWHRHLSGTEVEDAGTIILKAENGALGRLSMTWVSAIPQNWIIVAGTKGRMVYDYARGTELLVERPGEEKQVITVLATDGFKEEVGHFLAAVRGECELACTAEDGLRAMEVILPLYER